MAVTEGSGTFNTGRDVRVVLVAGDGTIVDMPNVISFDCAQETAAVKIDRLDGIQLPAEFPKGWTGTIELDRGSSGVDDLFALIEANWHNAGVYQVATLYQYITEGNGSTSTYQFDTVALKLTAAGSWKGDAPVRQRISFTANARRRV